MDYNNIILELFDRIKNLENKVNELEDKIELIYSTNNREDLNDNESIKEDINNIIENSNSTMNTQLGGNKYIKLSDYLKNSNKDIIELTFTDIENILGFKLSESARKYRPSWANTTNISFPCSWIKVGYKVVKIDMEKEEVTFARGSLENNYTSNRTYTCTGDKYYKLTNYLKYSNKDIIELTFTDIENILGFKLSESARKYRPCWANTSSISFPCSWMKVGYEVAYIDMENEKVTFKKSNN